MSLFVHVCMRVCVCVRKREKEREREREREREDSERKLREDNNHCVEFVVAFADSDKNGF